MKFAQQSVPRLLTPTAPVTMPRAPLGASTSSLTLSLSLKAVVVPRSGPTSVAVFAIGTKLSSRTEFGSLELAHVVTEVPDPVFVHVIVIVNGPNVNSVTVLPPAVPAALTTPFVPIWFPVVR
jgi:hypothetical protein